MYCKTKSIFKSCATEVAEGYDICSPIYDFSDFEDDSLARGNANVGQKDPPNSKESRKHKSKRKHKHSRHKLSHKEKQQQEKDQEEKEKEELANVEAHPREEKKNAEQRSAKTKQPAVPAEATCDSINKPSNHSKKGKSAPSGYSIGDAVLNFNVKRSKLMRTIQRPVYTTTALVIPKLKPVRRNVKVRPAETALKEHTVPVEWVQERTPHIEAVRKPPSPVPLEDYELLPGSEELWKIYEARKQGAKPEWPICCVQKVSKSEEFIPTAPPKRLPARTLPENEKPQSDAVTWLLENKDRVEELSMQVNFETDKSTNIMDMDSLEISLDEERGLLDCLKSMRLHTPLSDIKAFDMLQGLVRSEENRQMLHDLLKAKLLGQRGSKDEPKLLKEPIAQEREAKRFVKEKIAKKASKISISEVKEEPLAKQSIIASESEVLQQPICIVPLKDEVQPQAMEKSCVKNEQPMIISIETLPTGNAVPATQNEEAVQRWLQELGQHLSSVVQSRIKAMPTPSTEPNATTKSLAEPIDFEAEISQLPPPATGSGIAVRSEIADLYPPALSNSSPWEGSYKERLEKYDNVIDENMSEFRDPLEKRLRGRLTNSSSSPGSNSCNTYVINNSLENLKRVLLMPPLPSHLDQGLQQIRILRPPTKRKIEQAKLTIEMKTVRTYGTIHVNLKLDLNRLALEMDNAVYNSDIQVLQKRYEAAQIAWIWENGSVLITNVRNKTILNNTQTSLMSKILEHSTEPTLNERSMQQSQMITIAQFPWHICIEEFCQTYSLSTETIQGSFRYGYYVNKSIPSVAAKVYESGTIQVMAMSPTDADQMVQKLYLLTANHRKARSSRILPQAKPNYNGTFISLFPNKTDKAKSS